MCVCVCVVCWLLFCVLVCVLVCGICVHHFAHLCGLYGQVSNCYTPSAGACDATAPVGEGVPRAGLHAPSRIHLCPTGAPSRIRPTIRAPTGAPSRIRPTIRAPTGAPSRIQLLCRFHMNWYRFVFLCFRTFIIFIEIIILRAVLLSDARYVLGVLLFIFVP